MLPSLLDASSFLEISLQEAGRETCIADKHIRFTPKDYPVVHYVYSGQGQFAYGGKTYLLKPGDCFYIPAGEEATYQPFPENPWSYFWIGIGGTKSSSLLEKAGFKRSSPVLSDHEKAWKKYFEAIYDSYFYRGNFQLDALGEAYLLLQKMIESSEPMEKDALAERGHIQSAKAYIRNNFQFPISILDVASSVGVSPNYLANLFASQGEESPKRYLTMVRMEAATKLLKANASSISDISKAVGYASPLHFSKVFKSYYGVSPLHYRFKGER